MKTYSESDIQSLCDLGAPCFQKLTAEELELVKNSKTQVQFRRGENLTKQGAFASSVLFVLDGLVKQYVEGDGTRNFNLRVIRSGEFVGLSAVFNKNTFNYSAVALRETLVCLIEKDTMLNLVRSNSGFAYGIIKRYCDQDNDLFDIIRNTMYKQMPGKLADALLYLSADVFREEDIFTLLSRRDIADFAGISTESAVKLLKLFEKDGLIRLDEKHIIILNRDALLEVSRRG